MAKELEKPIQTHVDNVLKLDTAPARNTPLTGSGIGGDVVLLNLDRSG